jgi:hypothetical protein
MILMEGRCPLRPQFHAAADQLGACSSAPVQATMDNATRELFGLTEMANTGLATFLFKSLS